MFVFFSGPQVEGEEELCAESVARGEDARYEEAEVSAELAKLRAASSSSPRPPASGTAWRAWTDSTHCVERFLPFRYPPRALPLTRACPWNAVTPFVDRRVLPVTSLLYGFPLLVLQ